MLLPGGAVISKYPNRVMLDVSRAGTAVHQGMMSLYALNTSP
jgi:hypothetical protein